MRYAPQESMGKDKKDWSNNAVHDLILGGCSWLATNEICVAN